MIVDRFNSLLIEVIKFNGQETKVSAHEPRMGQEA